MEIASPRRLKLVVSRQNLAKAVDETVSVGTQRDDALDVVSVDAVDELTHGRF